MSGINRNILQNGGIPLTSQGMTNIDLQTTSGSRFVMMNFPLTFLSSSLGGTCEGITLQWTPDSSLGFETSSAYYAVTQSVLSCSSASLSPMTSSTGWVQFIDSIYDPTAPVYYMRAYQNLAGGGRGPYSDIVSIQTRNYGCGTNVSSYGGVGRESELYFDVNGFDPNTNRWYSNYGSPGAGAAFTASFSVAPNLIKLGGPNYDAIKTNGAEIIIDLKGSYAGQVGGPALPIAVSLGVASGSVEVINGAGGTPYFRVDAVDSTTAGNVQWLGSSPQPIFPNGVSTRNVVVGIMLSYNGSFYLNGTAVGTTTSTLSAINYSNYIKLSTSSDCVIRAFGVGRSLITATGYNCKYVP